MGAGGVVTVLLSLSLAGGSRPDTSVVRAANDMFRRFIDATSAA